MRGYLGSLVEAVDQIDSARVIHHFHDLQLSVLEEEQMSMSRAHRRTRL